jgi:hypothetical protein
MCASRSANSDHPKTKPPPEGGGEIHRENANQGLTVVVAEALLFAEFESGVEDSTLAVFVRVLFAGATTFTPIVIVAVADGAMVPILTRTVPLVPPAGTDEQLPTVVAQEPNVVPLGSGSLTSTELADTAPRLLTMIV